MWRPKLFADRAVAKAAGQVIDEATRLLAGRVAQSYGREWRVPAWVPANALAHAGSAELRRLAAEHRSAYPSTWRGTLASLAGEVLSSTRNDHELRRLQHDVLLPIELAVLADASSAPSTPGQLATLVRRAIEDRRVEPDRER